ncbi:hypothetical protein E2C01_006157 [Portunus trituberculatus]|uniref:Uncharacterized protein n=1 Tax=Portunus trituberculatus TaxID=210409 RepID=A0A5B7CX46_PORTR|nr:hypothetical protein [Portunus trituberculatus]
MLREWVKVGAATHSTHIHTFRFGARRQEQHAGRQCSKKTSVTLPSYSDMADRSEAQDSSNIEIIECREPHLEASQDLELLAQEIAEAAVEDERKKFLARGDLRQKLADLGFFTDPTAEASGDDRLTEQSLQNLVMSCSESIVICDLPEVRLVSYADVDVTSLLARAA